MFDTLQEIRKHIQDEKSDLTAGETRNYIVEPVLEYLEWPIRSKRNDLRITFNEDGSEGFDYKLSNSEGFSVLVNVEKNISTATEEIVRGIYSSISADIQFPVIHIVTNGVKYDVFWVSSDDVLEICKFDIMDEDSVWALNFLNADSIAENRSFTEGKKLAQITSDKLIIQHRDFPRSLQDVSFDTIDQDKISSDKDELVDNIDTHIEQEREKIKSKFIELIYGVNKGYEFGEIINRIGERILLVEKGGVGLDDYIGAGESWGATKLHDKYEPDYLGLVEPQSNIFRHLMKVEEIVEKDEFEKKKNVDLDSYRWYHEGEKLVRISQIYRLNKYHTVSEEVDMQDTPVNVNSTEIVESRLKPRSK